MTNNREDNSTSTSESTIPYYGSKVPRQSASEVDNIIFNMMDDIKNAALEEKGKISLYVYVMTWLTL